MELFFSDNLFIVLVILKIKNINEFFIKFMQFFNLFNNKLSMYNILV